jgi:hypothetical protein
MLAVSEDVLGGGGWARKGAVARNLQEEALCLYKEEDV